MQVHVPALQSTDPSLTSFKHPDEQSDRTSRKVMAATPPRDMCQVEPHSKLGAILNIPMRLSVPKQGKL